MNNPRVTTSRWFLFCKISFAMQEELQCLVHQIAEAEGGAITVSNYLLPSVSNVISGLLFGTRYTVGDPKRDYLERHLFSFLKLINSSPIAVALPDWISLIAANLSFTRIGAMRQCRKNLEVFVRERIKEHEATIQDHLNRDFIDGYLKKMMSSKSDPTSHFKECHLVGNVTEMFVAGSGSTADRIRWLLLVCAQRPDTVQSRIQREIDDAAGRERQPTWEDRFAMPFTMASVWELLRWKMTNPFGILRGTVEDCVIEGYFVPKDSVLMANSRAVHRDPRFWKNPDEFDPTRFLSSDGSELQKKPEQLIIFSLGKRMCPAEMLANVEMFLYLTSLLQKFKVLPEEGVRLPRLDSFDVTAQHPSVQKLRFIPR